MRLPVLAALTVLALSPVAAAEPVTVQIKAGVLSGTEQEGVRAFKNIPYAAPPVGKLRWAPPQPPPTWPGIRAADAFGSPCAQLDATRVNQARRISGEGIDIFFDVPMAAKASEDCLTLNVWAPAAAHKAPVMVFIYGGGGSADLPYWDGASFARDGVVLVNFNYRNLTMGKFAHPALTQASGRGSPLGRYDVMDQMAALKWVRRNVAAFGGDPNNVTVFGQSAGGAAVLQLLTVPSAKGLFDKAIVESGAGWWTPATQAENERLGLWVAKEAGLGPEATIEQLRALPVAAMPQIGHFTYDGRLMPRSPTEALGSGRVIDVPLMIGWNSFDGSSLRFGLAEVIDKASPALKAPYLAEGRTGDDLAYALYTDSHVAAPARWIASKLAGGAPTYLYQFSYVRPADRARSRGASHSAELPFVFDSWKAFAPALKLSAEEQAVTRMVHSCWVSFARTGRPQCEGAPAWPRYSASDDRLMDLGATAEVRQHVNKARLDAQDVAMPRNMAAQRAALEKILAMAP